MRVMSKFGRELLERLQDIRPDIQYDICDIEYYGNNYVLRVIAAWWNRKKSDNCNSYGGTQDWYLPIMGSADYNNLLKYMCDKKAVVKEFPLDWGDEHKQVYHYLCNTVLEHDFNQTEFKMILDIGSEFNIQDVQQIIENIKNRDGGTELPYIMSALKRQKQLKEVQFQRRLEAMERSQQWIKNIPTRKATVLEVALMDAEFREVRERQATEKAMREVREINKRKWGLK